MRRARSDPLFRCRGASSHGARDRRAARSSPSRGRPSKPPQVAIRVRPAPASSASTSAGSSRRWSRRNTPFGPAAAPARVDGLVVEGHREHPPAPAGSSPSSRSRWPVVGMPEARPRPAPAGRGAGARQELRVGREGVEREPAARDAARARRPRRSARAPRSRREVLDRCETRRPRTANRRANRERRRSPRTSSARRRRAAGASRAMRAAARASIGGRAVDADDGVAGAQQRHHQPARCRSRDRGSDRRARRRAFGRTGRRRAGAGTPSRRGRRLRMDLRHGGTSGVM